MSVIRDALPFLFLAAIFLAFYYFADQIFMLLYDLSGLISKYL